ncbi:MAG: hypothetical protein WKF54_13585 [Nocardioidaceae bacterium]
MDGERRSGIAPALRVGERAMTPPGWPPAVHPPDAPRWEDTAIKWLLDQCPPEYRMYDGLRRHPVVLARFATLHVEASIHAAQRGISEARVSLREVLPTEAVEGAIGMWEREGARLLTVRRAVGLIEEAFRGRRFRARL